jgi:hypothetical protein
METYCVRCGPTQDDVNDALRHEQELNRSEFLSATATQYGVYLFFRRSTEVTTQAQEIASIFKESV